MDAAMLATELKRFLDTAGRLVAYPSKRRPKILALFYLASKFEGGRDYSEKQVNEVLARWHTFSDWVMLRRDLFDRGFLGRTQNGARYWLNDKQPDLADFGVEPQ